MFFEHIPPDSGVTAIGALPADKLSRREDVENT